MTPEELKEIDGQIRKEVDEAVKVAKSDPELDEVELYGDIYNKCLEPTIRGITPFTEHTSKNTGRIINL